MKAGRKRDAPSTPPSPSLKNDGISLDREHLPRNEVIQEIYTTAKASQYVVIGSPPGTGKTSLIQLLRQKLTKEEDAQVIRINMSALHKVGYFSEKLIEKGIDASDPDGLAEHQNTWLLLDEAQRTYAEEYNPFWESVVKDISSSDAPGLFVVIASTYDLVTAESPACFRGLKHISQGINQAEAECLIDMHYKTWGYEGWEAFCSLQLKISVFFPISNPPLFHVGVIMAGIRMLDDMRKRAGQGTQHLTENMALDAMRKETFIANLDRCFALSPSALQGNFNARLLEAVIGGGDDEEISTGDPLLGPFIRTGVLTISGQFSTIAATWYYNHRCFPNRAVDPPDSLDSLIRAVLPLISARRLSDTLDNGFPKEATFQHLFNEAMSQLLPVRHAVIPVLNTKVYPPPKGSNGTGELDFYINGSLKWCLELLRSGDKIGKHLGRFDVKTGTYRNVEKNDYLVVDCRGPKTRAVEPSQNRCTLFFHADFKKCTCVMRLEDPVEFTLGN